MNTRAEPGAPTRVKVGQAKGRPMLSWVGKHPLRELPVYPAQEVERFALEGNAANGVDWSDWPAKYPQGGLLVHGDNKEVLAHLIANGFRGKVDLVYIDPPFDSGADYVRRVSLRGPKGTARLDGEGYTLGEQIQYTDIWANDTYLQFMYERLLLLKELLTPTGSISCRPLCSGTGGGAVRGDQRGSPEHSPAVDTRARIRNGEQTTCPRVTIHRVHGGMTTRDSSTIDGAPHAPNRRVSNAHGDLDEDGVIGHRVGQVVVDRAELRGDPSEKCGCAPVIGRDAARTLPFTAVHAALDAVDHLVGRSGAGGSLPRK